MVHVSGDVKNLNSVVTASVLSTHALFIVATAVCVHSVRVGLDVGEVDGLVDGEVDGPVDGDVDGEVDGDIDGEIDGDLVSVGDAVGEDVDGAGVGDTVGEVYTEQLPLPMGLYTMVRFSLIISNPEYAALVS